MLEARAASPAWLTGACGLCSRPVGFAPGSASMLCTTSGQGAPIDARRLGARDRWLPGQKGQSGPRKHPEVTNAVSSSLFGHFPLLANKSSVELQT